MQSSLRNMVGVLFLITLVASAAVGFIYRATEEPIAQAKAAKTAAALGEVLPEFDNDPVATVREVSVEGGDMKIYTAEKNGQVAGYAIETFTNNGFSGLIRMMVGFLPDGEIYNIEALEHAETPGLGSKIADPDNKLVVSFQGKNPAELKMSVMKDGGDIDALTASTITSRAYVEAVQRAYDLLQTIGK